METEPLERIDEHPSGETPEDVAILYSWANLQGAKYRDFSANRREYRAQMRHRAAEQLRLMELRAQSEAEAAATHAEAEAAAAHADADAATVKLAASRAMPAIAPEEILEEKEVERMRKASLREAAQQARRAAAERLEAARRAESAALADSIARREEREIAEAQASALRQAAQYHDSEMRSKQTIAHQPDQKVPGIITDPYSPQILAEGEYYEGPGTPVSELEAGRFRLQREYIEKSTGAELPSFKMPHGFSEEPQRPHPADRRPETGDGRALGHRAAPRRLTDMNPEDRDYYVDRQLREDRNSSIPFRREPTPPRQEAPRSHGPVSSPLYPAFRDFDTEAPRTTRAEVVSQIPDSRSEWMRETNDRDRERPETFADRTQPHAEPRFNSGYDGSLVSNVERAPERRPDAARPQAGQEDPYRFEYEESVPFATRYSPNESWPAQDLQPNPRPDLRPIARPDVRPESRPEFGQQARQSQSPTREMSRAMAPSGLLSQRPSVEATYNDGHESDALTEAGEKPSGFRPPWLMQAQAPRPSGARAATQSKPAPEKQTPRWLYPEQGQPALSQMPAQPVAPEPRATPSMKQRTPAAEAFKPNSGMESPGSLQASQEAVASRWFALKGVFAQPESAYPVERPVLKEKNRATPMIAVYSLAGGVGKTSLVATLGRALSSLGEKVLLVDTAAHGLLPFYFGASDLMPGAVRTFSPPNGSSDAPIHLVSYNLDLANGGNPSHGRDGKAQPDMVESLLSNSQQAARVLIDLNRSCGWLVERLAWLKPTVLVPLSADMNSLISLQAVEKSFAAMKDADGEPLRPVYLLNQFDSSLPLHIDLREVLRQQLGDRLLPLVIRRAVGVSEALAEGMTIVDYDPDSSAAQDFLGLANWIRAASAPAAAGFRNLRWSER